MKCYHHPSKDEVVKCGACNKPICRDCAEMYGVSSGEYAGQSLCYDCTTQLVAANVKEVETLKSKTRTELIIIGAMMVIGVILGAQSGDAFLAVFLGLLFGSGLAVFKAWGTFFWNGAGLGQGCIALFHTFIGPFRTIARIITRLTQMKKANEIIASDSQAIQEMRDYFAYTQVMEKQAANVDLAKLAEQGGALFENTYARAVIEKGKDTAQADLRNSVVKIAANGEIIRGFNTMDKKPKKKDKAA